MRVTPADFMAGSLRLHLGDRTGDGTGGPEIRVYGPTAKDNVSRQLLRFDCFAVEPHYHYTPDDNDDKRNMDTKTVSESVAWSLTQLRENLSEMILQAGGSEQALADSRSPALQEALADLSRALNS